MDDTERALWLAARAGKLTASRMGDAMSFLKNGRPTEARSKYMRELLAERLTGYTMRHVVTPAMEWGLEMEPEAKEAYEVQTGNLIRESVFYEHASIENFGATPDGELEGHGLLEVKCPSTSTYVDWVMAGKVPEQHVPQMLAQLACTGRKWVEFVAYDPRVRQGPRIFIRRFEPKAEEIAAVEAAAVQFLDELERMFELFTTGGSDGREVRTNGEDGRDVQEQGRRGKAEVRPLRRDPGDEERVERQAGVAAG